MKPVSRAVAAPYRLVEVEMTEPLPAIELGDAFGGAHVLARWNGRPVGRAWLHRAGHGASVAPGRLDEELGWEVAQAVMARRALAGLDPAGPPAPTPSLTIAVCTRNRAGLLTRCLRSMLAMARIEDELGRALEILVVDNAPSDGSTREAAAALPGIRYVREPLPGLDFARNRAIAETRSDYLAYIDDDAVMDPGWLDGFADAVRRSPDATGFTGLVLPHALDTEAQIRVELAGGFGKGFLPRRYGPEAWGDPIFPCGAGMFGTGANMVFRVETLRRLGGFDEALDTGPPLPGGGDLDIYYRLVRAGGPLLYEPDMLVFHEHRRDMEGLRKQYYTWGLGLMAMLRKNMAADTAMRRRHRLLVAWWTKHHVLRLALALAGQGATPASHVWAELLGGAVGFFGEYQRSQARVAQRRKDHPA